MLRFTRVSLLISVAACSVPKPPADSGVPPTPVVFSVVQSELPATLLSAWESSDGVLYAVGGTADRAFVVRHDATGWWEMDPGTDSALWWVFGFSADDVYAVGANGVVTHFDGTRWRVEREGADYTLYGVWGTSPANLLAVGGNVQSSRARGVVLARAAGWGETITALPSSTPLFKIWGRSVGDFFVVGERGLVAHGGVGGLQPMLAPTTQRLTTVHGNQSEVFAVGGSTGPALLRLQDLRWNAVELPGSPSVLNGVAVAPTGQVLVVGFGGYVAGCCTESGAFAVANSGTTRDLHAAFALRDGFVAVGGDLLGSFEHGVIISTAPSLTSGALRPWPNPGERFDAGVDAGPPDAGPQLDGGDDAGTEDAGFDGGSDAGPPDGGWLSEGELCDGRYTDCRPGLDCWFVFGPFKSYCAALCTDVTECGAYGANACCKVPGPQVMTPVCLPEIACDAGN